MYKPVGRKREKWEHECTHPRLFVSQWCWILGQLISGWRQTTGLANDWRKWCFDNKQRKQPQSWCLSRVSVSLTWEALCLFLIHLCRCYSHQAHQQDSDLRLAPFEDALLGCTLKKKFPIIIGRGCVRALPCKEMVMAWAFFVCPVISRSWNLCTEWRKWSMTMEWMLLFIWNMVQRCDCDPVRKNKAMQEGHSQGGC